MSPAGSVAEAQGNLAPFLILTLYEFRRGNMLLSDMGYIGMCGPKGYGFNFTRFGHKLVVDVK